MLGFTLTLCGSYPVSATHGAGDQAQDTLYPFQARREAFECAQRMFCANPSQQSFEEAMGSLQELLSVMDRGNVIDARYFSQSVYQVFEEEETIEQEMKLKSLRVGDVSSLVRQQFLSDVSQNDEADLRALDNYLQLSQDRAFLFAGQNLAQKKLHADIRRMRRLHVARYERMAWQALDKEMEAHTDDLFFLNFRLLTPPLKELLLVTKGDKKHPQWSTLIKNTGAERVNSRAWNRLYFMGNEHLAGRVESLLQAHAHIMAYFSSLQTVNMALQAFGKYDDYCASYAAVSKFVWSVEKELLKESLHEREEDTHQRRRFYPTRPGIWPHQGGPMGEWRREMIMESLRALMVHRFAVTKLFYLLDVNPSALAAEVSFGSLS
ncbi:MAG: hypothetical protein C0514_01760 [Candidatus Puniceispirillum sp.]|nr:hypothetical protein [Candidatus Puniceispirillum sp.]